MFHRALWMLVLCARLHSASALRSDTRVQTAAGQDATARCTNPGPHAQTTPPAGALVVDATGAYASKSGSARLFRTVSAAAAALDAGTSQAQTIFVFPGTYREQVRVPPLRGPLVVQGYTCDARTYDGNAVAITHSLSLGGLAGADADDDHTATLRLWTAGGLRVYNVDVDNAFGPHPPAGGQALAVSASAAGGQAFYACRFGGYQDTLLAQAGPQLYVGCRIQGAVDFVFGQAATAWLERCDIRTAGPGSITASGRDADSNPSWYVIHNSTVDAAEEDDDDDKSKRRRSGTATATTSALAGQSYLGRPWADHARVVFQRTYLGDVVHPAGWSVWSKTAANTAHVFFGEYGNYGPGSVAAGSATKRASFSRQLAAPIDIATVLGPSWASQWWVDKAYLN